MEKLLGCNKNVPCVICDSYLWVIKNVHFEFEIDMCLMDYLFVSRFLPGLPSFIEMGNDVHLSRRPRHGGRRTGSGRPKINIRTPVKKTVRLAKQGISRQVARAQWLKLQKDIAISTRSGDVTSERYIQMLTKYHDLRRRLGLSKKTSDDALNKVVYLATHDQSSSDEVRYFFEISIRFQLLDWSRAWTNEIFFSFFRVLMLFWFLELSHFRFLSSFFINKNEEARNENKLYCNLLILILHIFLFF